MRQEITVTPDTLRDSVEFYSVFYSHGDGATIHQSPEPEPTCLDEELDSSGWEFFSTGYTGQYSYSGPVMHDSEYLGGRLAQDILSTRGHYVLLPADYSRCAECEGDSSPCERCECETYTEGWVVAHRPDPEGLELGL